MTTGWGSVDKVTRKARERAAQTQETVDLSAMGKPVVYLEYVCEKCGQLETLPEDAHPLCSGCNYRNTMVLKK